jgi:hypothetical protein
MRWMVFCTIIVLLHIIGGASAHAQTQIPPTATNTPTPTPTNTPVPGTPTPTPVNLGGLATPVPTPTSSGGQSNTVWGCRYVVGTPPFCTWGTEFSWFLAVEDPPQSGTTAETRYLFIVAPVNAEAIDYSCSFVATAHRGASQSLTVRMGEASGFLGGGRVDRIMTYDSQLNGVMSDTYATTVYLISPTGTWADWSVIPSGTNVDVTDYIQIRVAASMLSYTPEQNKPLSEVNVGFACTVSKIYYKDGTENLPNSNPQYDFPTVTPTPSGSPTPLTCYIGCGEGFVNQPWNTPVAWVHIPAEIEFGSTPVSTTCYTLIPALAFGPYTIFGNEIGIEIPYFELCNSSYSIAWKLFDINFGAWATALLMVGAVGLLYSRFK